MKERLRFAPSPTGYLHIGGVRTALFNWLYARKTNGKFILRIEDTDKERNSKESVDVIIDSLKWLGMDWDEGPVVGGNNGPYFQSERLELYRDVAEQLIKLGLAYRCYCSKDDSAAARAEFVGKNPKDKFKYPGTCRDKKGDLLAPHVIRFDMSKVNKTHTTFVDKVFGEISTPNDAQQDFVIMRPDGIPLYNFGSVVDDYTMGITTVMRGRDHIVNTPPQILLYEAIGAKVPVFAHLPMMLSTSGKKLSKRNAAVGVDEYMVKGYTPNGVLNYLARFGWSCGDQEVFSRDDLISKFDIKNINKSDGRFDEAKFADIAFSHLKVPELTSDDDYIELVIPFLNARGLHDIDKEILIAALPLIRPRGKNLVDAAEALDYFFRDKLVFDEKAVKKFMTSDKTDKLSALIDNLGYDFSPHSLECNFRKYMEKEGITMKDIAQTVRVSLTGRKNSPSLYDVMHVLGKDKSIERLTAGVEMCRRHA